MVLLAGCSQVGNLAVAQDTTAQVLWNRGGSAPELSQVTFELSVNGCATWTSLGAGTRVGPTAYWQRTGLALPTSGQIRARGSPSGGNNNGSAGWVQTVVSFSGIAPAALAASPAIHMTRVTGDDGTLRVEFEAPVGAGSVEVWSAETVDDETWTRLDGSPVRNATTGLLELRMPVDPHRPQQFYRLVIHSEPVSSGEPR